MNAAEMPPHLTSMDSTETPMTKDQSVFEQLESIRKKLPYDDAERCISILDDEIKKCKNIILPGVALMKLNAMRRISNFEQLRNELDAAYSEYPSDIGINYMFGEVLVENLRENEAIVYLENVLDISGENMDEWYRDAAKLLLGYCFYRAEKNLKAKQMLSELSEDVSMKWIKTTIPLSKADILSAME